MGPFFVSIIFILLYLKLFVELNKVIIHSNNLIFLSKVDPELERAWGLLPGGDPVSENHGEVWQYMGTELNGKGGPGWYHCFRHRNYRNEGRVYRFFPVPENWTLPKRRKLLTALGKVI